MVFVVPVTLFAAAAGAVHGTVVGPDNRPMPGVVVTLRNDVTGFHQNTATGIEGTYTFFNVPYNPYVIRVEVQGFAPVARTIDVHSAVPVEAPIKLALAQLTESISVTAAAPVAQLETDNSQSHVDIDKSYIAKAPAAVASRAMEQIVTSTPGFAKDENGRFHFQGAHSQSEYVIDGQTISDQTGVTFSNSIDPGIAQGIEIIYGNVPAEFGEKIGAVVNLTTKSGLGSGSPKTDAYVGVSKFSTAEAGISVGGGSQTFGYFGSVDATKSDRFLDPVNFDNLHNRGNTERGFLRLDRQSSDQKSSFRFTTLLGATRRDVPNTFTQEASGQNQKVIVVLTAQIGELGAKASGFGRNTENSFHKRPLGATADPVGIGPVTERGSGNHTETGGRRAAHAAAELVADGAGEIGFVNPVSEPFCSSCDRIRITADGQLRTCLFSQREWDLKTPLREGADDRELVRLLRFAVRHKELKHRINDPGFVRASRSMSQIGG